MITCSNGTIVENNEISPGIYKLLILAKDIANLAEPGQFINVYLNSEVHLLPRPISICEINKEQGILSLVYAVVGKGTRLISKYKADEKIKIMGPVGNGFEIEEDKEESIILGGGVGIPPLLELVKQLKGKKTVFLGFRSSIYLVDEFKKHCDNVYISTENGAEGIKGNVINLLNTIDPSGKILYSCGPKPMLKAVNEWADKKGISTQLSFEERMACGIGACLVCTCKTKKKEESDWEHRRVCKDGPVFKGEEVVWDE